MLVGVCVPVRVNAAKRNLKLFALSLSYQRRTVCRKCGCGMREPTRISKGAGDDEPPELPPLNKASQRRGSEAEVQVVTEFSPRLRLSVLG